MKLQILVLVFTSTLSISFGQEIKGTWLLTDRHLLQIEESKIYCEPFNFIKEYTINADTLTFRHVYDTAGQRCETLDAKGKWVKVKCEDNSISNSKFLITKLTRDSLFIVPINNSAKAVSAGLKHRYYYGAMKRIAAKPDSIDYYQVIKFYNQTTLYEQVSWDTITVSHKSNGWWGRHYFDIQILNNGQFIATDHYKPFKERKPNKDQRTRTTYYKDTLSTELIQEIKNEVNKSGIMTVDKTDFGGGATHTRIVTFKMSMKGGDKMIKGYENAFPYFLRPLIKIISDLEYNKDFKTTTTKVSIGTSYIEKKE
ncbi:MAG: hypothetical protein KF846_09080 [Cyclobacteriaceae bacterium]|nr:hypothetical protein [Cyclobacteriaceae bacterium]